MWTYTDHDLVSHRVVNGTVGFERGLHSRMTAVFEHRAAAVGRNGGGPAWLLDVGAHVGIHDLQFASRGTPVVAFEPFPDMAQRLVCS